MEKDFVREIADLYSARFHHLAEIGIVKEMSFEIDSKDFEDKYRDLEDVRYATPFKMMFEQLAEVDEKYAYPIKLPSLPGEGNRVRSLCGYPAPVS